MPIHPSAVPSSPSPSFIAGVKKIALFRALNIGDMLCAIPAFRAVRKAFPESELTLIGLPWAQAFSERFSHYIDRFIEFPGYPGLPEQSPSIERIPAFLNELQSLRFDLAIQMHGSGAITNSLVGRFGARVCAGYFPPDRDCPDKNFFFPWHERGHEVWKYLHLLSDLGIPLQGDHLEFPIFDADRSYLIQYLAQHRIQYLAKYPLLESHANKPFICIQAGARNRHKCWPPEKFAAVADSFAYAGFKIVLTGTANEADLTRSVIKRMRANHSDVVFDTAALDLPLGALAALLNQSRMLISNDTGVSHLASALRLPSVVIFSATDPERWAPLNRDIHRPIRGAKTNDVDQVIKEARQLLGFSPIQSHNSQSEARCSSLTESINQWLNMGRTKR